MSDETKAYWAKQVTLWQQSGLTLREYSANSGIGASSLKNWKWRLGVEARQQTTNQRGFVEVMQLAHVPSEKLELVYRDGLRVSIPVGFDEATLRRLLSVVEER